MSTRNTTPIQRVNYGRIPDTIEVGNLIEIQTASFDWFLSEGLTELFNEINPVTDYTGKNYELRFVGHRFGEPPFDEEECRQRDMTFAAPLYVTIRLHIKTGPTAGEIKESEVFLGEFPLMTSVGTFIINGTERVVVSQLVRSPGVYFTATEDATTGRPLFSAKLIPNRGAWLEIETSSRDVLTVKIDRKRKIPVTTLVRALGYATDDDIRSFFKEVDTNGDHQFIQSTLEKDTATTVDEALIEVYRKQRPGDPPTLDNARNLLSNLFFNARRFDLGRVGRFKLDKNLGIPEAEARKRAHDAHKHVLDNEDFISIIRKLIALNNGNGEADDIDHLGNRRVRAVGELLQNQCRMGLVRMERIIKERMSLCDAETVTSASLVNARPVVAAVKEFFGSSQLSQFMDQTNPLSELTNKRRLSALGPGGLSRERAGYDVRDVHHSHYGRICPIETPEGPNIGLIGSLATFAHVNEFGFIETPFRRVYRDISPEDRKLLLGRKLTRDYPEVKASSGDAVTEKMLDAFVKAGMSTVSIEPWVSSDIQYLSADEEDKFTVAQANAPIDENGHFLAQHIACRSRHTFKDLPASEVDYMDVSPKQTVSVATSLIPFLEHDDANRALMGSNMQRQAVPLVVAESPIVGTGMEGHAARNSGELITADVAGTIIGVGWPEPEAGSKVVKLRNGENTGTGVLLRPDDGAPDRWYGIHKFVRSNQATCLNQRVAVIPGQHVDVGDVLVDGPATDHGELALGRNVLVAFMPWEGYNYEDAILISESVVREDKYTSIHIEEFETEARDTKLGPEEITRNLPNVSEESLKNLNDRGVIYIGAEVGPGDILVGKVTPKGESELSAEERLLRAIFGEKAREVRDSSLRVPHGERGVVVDVKILSRESGHDLPPGVNELIRVYIAQKRKISQGDKMAGRHGNKGVIARILALEDMPYLPDGTPVEIVLNPLGVPSRMNLGQVLETHLGYAAQALGIKAATPVFDGATEEVIEQELERAGLPKTGKQRLRDGRTGEFFDREVTVGYIYMLKLAHMVEDKIHARSTGPYSLVTQQPLGGKAQCGGQRFGEMEGWALEAYGASHILQELLTIKSDDIVGRVKAYEAIVKGENTLEAGIPESFRVLVKELEGLGLGVEIQSDDESQIILSEDDSSDVPIDLGIHLERDEREDADEVGR